MVCFPGPPARQPKPPPGSNADSMGCVASSEVISTSVKPSTFNQSWSRGEVSCRTAATTRLRIRVPLRENHEQLVIYLTRYSSAEVRKNITAVFAEQGALKQEVVDFDIRNLTRLFGTLTIDCLIITAFVRDSQTFCDARFSCRELVRFVRIALGWLMAVQMAS